MTAIELYIDGVQVRAPKPGGITRKVEKIWSKNTGRTATAKMQGTILATKTTYSLEWNPLAIGDQAQLESLICDPAVPFHTIRIVKPDGSSQEVECYFGTPSFTEWDMIGGQWRCKSAKVDAIER